MPLFGNNFLDFFKLAVLQKRWFYELLQDSNLKVVFCVGPDSDITSHPKIVQWKFFDRFVWGFYGKKVIENFPISKPYSVNFIFNILMYQTWNYNACKGYRIKKNTEGNFFLINHKMPKITWAEFMVIDWKQDFICNTGTVSHFVMSRHVNIFNFKSLFSLMNFSVQKQSNFFIMFLLLF